MPLSRRRGASDELNPWPGYVDALSTLLMVIIFVLLVFVLAQAFLSVALTGRDRALDRLNRQVAELTDMLSLERGRSGELQLSVASLNRDLQAANAARDQLTRDLAGLRDEQAKSGAERDALRAERDRLSARLADAELQAQSALARNEQLQGRIAETAGRTDAAGQEAASIAAQLADTRRQLAKARADAEAVQAELDRTVKADKATIEARLADIAKLSDQVRALAALRDELEQQAREAAARATTAEQQRQAVAAQLADEQKLGESARAQIALLNQQVAELRAQMQRVASALDIAEKAGRDKDAQITNLSSRLNVALASKVEELQRYRSEFFGRLREVLQNRQDIQVVGDRFVFQSEVLFPVGSAELTPSGQDQIRALAATLKQIAAEIPSDLQWILRVDGHADKQPVSGGQFASNWELSAQRAINVVKLLVQEGIPPTRLAATGFGEFQPLDGAETPASYARNRRIELRLTDR
ncbi:MAG: peptidoglycan -binding protein [Acetobacteraceae bacterium]|nr:peptidoglycan -binding protein [Acetobacteraceae bacterium]